MIAPRTFPILKINVTTARIYRAPLIVLLALILLSGHGAYAQQPAKVLRLSKVEVKGLEQYTLEQVVTASGLQIGQPIDIPAADEAATRLMDSGLFKKLSYRFRSTGDQAVVIFDVEETKVSARVIFDNFIWFSDEELVAAVRRDIPTFDGTAPESGDVTDKITKSLQRLLAERKLPGQVEYIFSADLAGNNARHIYTVGGLKMPICALHFPGAVDVKESELINASKPIIKQNYSGQDVKAFAGATLLPLYRQRGHLRASFLDPVVKPETAADCQNGVTVSLQVDEGSIYTWDKAEWTGNAAFSAQELSAALAIKSGDRADGTKIDKAPQMISALYGKRGYLMVKMSAKPLIDDSNRRISYQYNITDGPQFKMGELVLLGFADAEVERLKERWKILPGEIFDSSYPKTFFDKNLRDILTPGATVSEISIEFKPDPQKFSVNVVINLKKEKGSP